MTLTWKQHIVGWKAGALQPCCVFSFANLELEFQHLVWFKKREIKMVLGRPLSFWNLVPDHPLSFQTQACLVFVARKDENRKDVRQLHQSARIPLPPPTSALELYIWFFKGDDSRHKFQFHLGHYTLVIWLVVTLLHRFGLLLGFASIKTTNRSPREKHLCQQKTSGCGSSRLYWRLAVVTRRWSAWVSLIPSSKSSNRSNSSRQPRTKGFVAILSDWFGLGMGTFFLLGARCIPKTSKDL